jgi:hypothetical protein
MKNMTLRNFQRKFNTIVRAFVHLIKLDLFMTNGCFIGEENQRPEKVVLDYRFPFSLTRGCSNRHALNTKDKKRQQIENSNKA